MPCGFWSHETHEGILHLHSQCLPGLKRLSIHFRQGYLRWSSRQPFLYAIRIVLSHISHITSPYKFGKALDRLALIRAQDALILLRASFSAPRVQHLLQCSPSVNNSLLQTFADLLRSAVSRITTLSGFKLLCQSNRAAWV